MSDPATVSGVSDFVGVILGSGGGTVGGGALVWYLINKKTASTEGDTSTVNAIDKRLTVLEERTVDKIDTLSEELHEWRREGREWREQIIQRFAEYDRNIAEFYRKQFNR